jgi:hypothetical protein
MGARAAALFKSPSDACLENICADLSYGTVSCHANTFLPGEHVYAPSGRRRLSLIGHTSVSIADLASISSSFQTGARILTRQAVAGSNLVTRSLDTTSLFAGRLQAV